MQELPLITIIGPTGIGKTTLALDLAAKYPIEIISLDSMLVYRYCNIGTAKPTIKELTLVAHHMIDILDPWENYSVARYIEDIEPIINSIRNNNKIPILVGGTMMYLWAMINGLDATPTTDQAIRKNILLTAETNGWHFLWHKLYALQPLIAEKIQPNDKQRISRALELALLNSNFVGEKSKQFNLKIISLWPETRDNLYNNLNNRVVQMIEKGLIEEVTKLKNDFNNKLNSSILNAVGYRQVFSYLAHEYDYSTMLLKVQQANRNLAKKQLTWMRKLKNTKLSMDLSVKNNALRDINNVISSLIKQQI